ncbi:hypothetical protein OPV22_020327 [Ensete ventricosum]|uniref:Secreted protein n=1 Tax=Ensete ventricosum TaxID=4639 RepID=A0AAV8PA25_ENSVE|nr:hypothetical protein OPV22_020327 [Ensete ventricosum]
MCSFLYFTVCCSLSVLSLSAFSLTLRPDGLGDLDVPFTVFFLGNGSTLKHIGANASRLPRVLCLSITFPSNSPQCSSSTNAMVF